MNGNWEKVYSASMAYKVEIVQALLKEHDIESVIMNKKDSAYLFGDVELYVKPEQHLQAVQIIKQNNL